MANAAQNRIAPMTPGNMAAIGKLFPDKIK
jgi:hypothetical protein